MQLISLRFAFVSLSPTAVNEKIKLMCICVSDGYAVHDIDYFWGDKRTDPPHIAIKFGSDLVLPQFEPSKYNVNNVVSETDSGCHFTLIEWWRSVFCRQIQSSCAHISVHQEHRFLCDEYSDSLDADRHHFVGVLLAEPGGQSCPRRIGCDNCTLIDQIKLRIRFY